MGWQTAVGIRKEPPQQSNQSSRACLDHGPWMSDSFTCINTTCEKGCDIHDGTNRRLQPPLLRASQQQVCDRQASFRHQTQQQQQRQTHKRQQCDSCGISVIMNCDVNMRHSVLMHLTGTGIIGNFATVASGVTLSMATTA